MGSLFDLTAIVYSELVQSHHCMEGIALVNCQADNPVYSIAMDCCSLTSKRLTFTSKTFSTRETKIRELCSLF